MVKSYCVKQKKQTESVEPSGYKTAKNGRLMFWCTCAECGIKMYIMPYYIWPKRPLRWADITVLKLYVIKSYRKKLSTTLWIN